MKNTVEVLIGKQFTNYSEDILSLIINNNYRSYVPLKLKVC